jgi:hypothetical protein
LNLARDGCRPVPGDLSAPLGSTILESERALSDFSLPSRHSANRQFALRRTTWSLGIVRATPKVRQRTTPRKFVSTHLGHT